MKPVKPHLVLLADRPRAVTVVAEWLHGEWGHERIGSSPSALADELRGKLSRDRLPVHLLAVLGDVEVGVAALKTHKFGDQWIST